MPAISNALLPDEAASFAVGGPMFRTHIVTSANGTEQRNAIGGLHPRRQFTIDSGVMSGVQAAAFINFHQSRRGMWESFRCLDPFDYTVPNGQVVLISGNQYQLVKPYVHGAYTYLRPIIRLRPGTVNFVGGSGLSLDYNTGVLTASSPPTSYTGFFEMEVRYQQDAMTYNIGGGDQRTVSLSVIEVFDTVWKPLTMSQPPENIGVGPGSDDYPEINSDNEPQPRTHLISINDIQEERFQYGISPAPVVQTCRFLYSSYDALQGMLATFMVARGRRSLWQHNYLGLCRFASDQLIISRVKFDSYTAEAKVLRYV